jgi:hypothetical protein
MIVPLVVSTPLLKGTVMITWEQLSELEQLATIYSDTFKEVYGVRPRHTATWTEQDYKDELDSLDVIRRDNADFEEREEAEAIARVMRVVGVDKDTAIRWLYDADDRRRD